MACHRNFARGGTPRRKSLWLFIGPGDSTLSTSGVLLASLNVSALALRPFTIVRTHLEVMVRSDQAAAIEHQLAAIGACVVTDEALAVGISAIPTPVADAGSDAFFVHQFVFGDESALTDRTRSATRLSIDSKAMRKVEDGFDVAFVSDLSSILQGGVMTFGGRMLLKLH